MCVLIEKTFGRQTLIEAIVINESCFRLIITPPLDSIGERANRWRYGRRY
jgi:hypothetical protein